MGFQNQKYITSALIYQSFNSGITLPENLSMNYQYRYSCRISVLMLSTLS